MTNKILKSFALGMALLPSLGATALTERVSVANDGTEILGGASMGGQNILPRNAVSADGRYVVFRAGGENIVPGISCPSSCIFLRDRIAQTTELVSIDHQGNTRTSVDVFSMSHDGRYVAFSTRFDEILSVYAFVYDRQTQLTEIVSLESNGDAAQVSSRTMAMSSNGRYIAYASESVSISSADINLYSDIFLYDQELKTTELISVDSNGTQWNHDVNWVYGISNDGRYVLFNHGEPGFGPNPDVYVRDRTLGITKQLNIGDNGVRASLCLDADMSDDGRYVIFRCSGGYGLTYIYLHDNETNLNTLITQPIGGLPTSGLQPSISGDGRYITFSSSNNFVPEDSNGQEDVYRYEIATGLFTLVSQSSSGQQGNQISAFSSISRDGNYVVFRSYATNLIENDINGYSDIYIRELDVAEISISPASGKYISDQEIDLVLILENPTAKPVNSVSLIWNGMDASGAFNSCAIEQGIAAGGTAWKCANLAVNGLFSSGEHNFTATIEFTDGSSVSNAATWTVIENTGF